MAQSAIRGGPPLQAVTAHRLQLLLPVAALHMPVDPCAVHARRAMGGMALVSVSTGRLVDRSAANGDTPIFSAICGRSLGFVRWLLEEGHEQLEARNIVSSLATHKNAPDLPPSPDLTPNLMLNLTPDLAPTLTPIFTTNPRT